MGGAISFASLFIELVVSFTPSFFRKLVVCPKQCVLFLDSYTRHTDFGAFPRRIFSAGPLAHIASLFFIRLCLIFVPYLLSFALHLFAFRTPLSLPLSWPLYVFHSSSFISFRFHSIFIRSLSAASSFFYIFLRITLFIKK